MFDVKTISVMRGIPGSGKSTVAKRMLKQAYEGWDIRKSRANLCIIVSADDFFMQDEKYVFDATKLGDAHRACMQSFLHAADMGFQHIIVDNTNLNIEDIAPYVAVGEALGYEVSIIQVPCEPEVASQRNIHGVPASRYKDMEWRYKNVRLPKRWKVVTS